VSTFLLTVPRRALNLSQIVDNVVRYGRVANPAITDDKNVDGIRVFLQHVKGDTEVDCTTIGTAGEKGYDGFLYAVRL